jgi:hypothetical protein
MPRHGFRVYRLQIRQWNPYKFVTWDAVKPGGLVQYIKKSSEALIRAQGGVPATKLTTEPFAVGANYTDIEMLQTGNREQPK